MTRRLVTAGAVCLALLAMTSCGAPPRAGGAPAPAGRASGPQGTVSRVPGGGAQKPRVSARQRAAIRRSMHCQRRLPASDAPFRTGPAPGVRRGPAVAMICEYEYYGLVTY